MIIFINEDEAYLAWLAAHSHGFVVNARRRPAPRYLILHRARCAEISGARHAHLTSGPYIKICAHSATELAQWAKDDVGGHLRTCDSCQPHIEPAIAAEPAPNDAEHPHLTRMGEHILSHILELAVISLDGMGDYAEKPPTVKRLASSFGKTVPQLRPILRRLLEDGFISVDGETSPEARLSTRSVIYPTATSLRTIPAFAAIDDAELSRALGELHERSPG